MLTIRLQRTGKKNQADFRIVLTEKEAPVSKKFLEVLGSYNPRKKYFQVKEDRLKHWLGQHVALSETVNNLLVTKGLFSGPKVKAFSIPKKPAPAPAPAEAKKEDTTPVQTPDSAKATSGEPGRLKSKKKNRQRRRPKPFPPRKPKKLRNPPSKL